MSLPRLVLSVIGDEIGPSLDEMISFAHEHGLKRLDMRTVGGRNLLGMTKEEVIAISRTLEKAGRASWCACGTTTTRLCRSSPSGPATSSRTGERSKGYVTPLPWPNKARQRDRGSRIHWAGNSGIGCPAGTNWNRSETIVSQMPSRTKSASPATIRMQSV